MMLKKSRAMALFLACAMSAAYAAPAFAGEGDEPYITHNLPQTIKIGEEFPNLLVGDFGYVIHNLVPGAFVDSWMQNPTSFPAKFTLHAGRGPIPREVDENGNSVCFNPLRFICSFSAPGTISITVGYEYYDSDDESLCKPIGGGQIDEPITIEVEKPVIKTNAPKIIEVGSTLQFTTELTNTALVNTDTAYYLDENNYDDHGWLKSDGIHNSHEAAYQPSVEIIEGKELVKQTEQDYSNTLKSSETLSFVGAGTVKLKVKYNQFVTCQECQREWDENGETTRYTYNPEEIITILVTDNSASYYTHDFPETIKIGESIWDCGYVIHNLIPGTLVESYGLASYPSEDIPRFFSSHRGGPPIPRKVDENGNVPGFNPFASSEAVYAPGTISLKVDYQYCKYIDDYDYEPIGDEYIFDEPITIEVEKPIIKTNAPTNIEVGSTLQFTTELTNTALVNTDTAYYLDENNYYDGGSLKDDGTHKYYQAAYQPSVEIIEGKELVKQTDQDYSNTLKSSETLSFIGEGTVKLKVKYNQFVTCPDCQWGRDENGETKYYTYNPEEIITIQVTDSSSNSSTSPEVGVRYDVEEGITIEGDTVFPSGTVITAEEVTTGDLYEQAKAALSNTAEKIVVLDINAVKDGKAVQPNGKVKVTIAVPDGFSDKVSLYYVSDKGTAEKIESTFDKESGTLTAELEHFSTYVLADESTKPEEDNNTGTKPDDSNTVTTSGEDKADNIPDTGDADSLLPLLAVMSLSGIALCVMGKKKRS